MRLIELHPSLVGDVLKFDCPTCKDKHKVILSLVGNKNAKRTWSIYNREDWDKTEVRPSIRLDCCHFTINNGEVRVVGS